MNAPSRVVAKAGTHEPAAALFRLMAEQWPGAVIVLDRDLRVRWVNNALLTLFADRAVHVPNIFWRDLGLPWKLGPQFLRDLGAAGELRFGAERIPGLESAAMHTARFVPLRETPNLITAVLCVLEPSAAAVVVPATVPAPQPPLNETQVGYWVWDFETRSFSVDERWCRAMNLDSCAGPEHLEQWSRHIHPDDVAEYRRKRVDIECGRADGIEAEYRMLTADMRWIWVLHRGRVVHKEADGRARRTTGICIEIDDRKRAEVALQENEARLATALWGARAAFWQWHIVTDTMTLSPLWFAITGYTREQWDSIPKPWTSRIHPEDRDRVSQRIRLHLEGHSQSIETEFRVRTAADDWKWMLMRGRVIEWDFDGRPTSAIGVSLDIDGQKRAELELRSSEARLETAVWGVGMGLWEIDFRHEWTRWFSDWCERLDLDPCDGKNHVGRWDSNIHPEDVQEASRRFTDHVAGKEEYYDAEYRIRDKKGRWRWLFERGRSVERAKDGTAVRMVGICMDIDARKAEELSLIKSQKRLEIALESARGGMWDWNVVTDESVVTEFIYRMLGVEPEQGRLEKEFWSSRVHPDDLARVLEGVRRIAQGETELFEAEYRLRHNDGNWRWVLDRGRVAERDSDSGKITRVVGFIVEITDRIKTQEALRASEFRYRTVASVTPGYIFEYRFDEAGQCQPVWVSDGTQGMYGCSVSEFIEHGGCRAFIHPDSAAAAREYYQKVYSGHVQTGEIGVRTIDGQARWMEFSITPLRDTATGKVSGYIGAGHDITRRKLAERALRDSEAILRAVTENMPDWLFLIDRERRVQFQNRTYGSYKADDIRNRRLLELIPDAHRLDLDALYERVFETGQPGRFDFRQTNGDGSLTHYEHRVVPVLESGTVNALTVAVTDVSERRSQENTLRTQARILETMREGVVLVDSDSRIQLTNETFNSMFGYRSIDLLGRHIEPLFSIPPVQRKRFERSLRNGSEARKESLPVEFECARRDGSRFVASCLFTPLTVAGKYHWLAVLNDVTERKRLEREIIEIANREQQRIGGDLHDGLGQDLTGIALMLRGVMNQLHKEGSAARLDVEDVISLVNSAIESTRALARGLSPVSPDRGGLSAALRALAVRAGDRYGVYVAFHDEVKELPRLDETAATHLYRIAQEALTNVIRHSLATEVRIQLETTADELQLRIEDNGRGFMQYPPDGANGLGLKIMRYRAQMLGGDLVLEPAPNGGALVRCSCPHTQLALGERSTRSAFAPHEP